MSEPTKPTWQWPRDSSPKGLGSADAQWGQNRSGETAVREAIQNSMDAADHRDECRVHLEVIERKVPEIPDAQNLINGIEERMVLEEQEQNDTRSENVRRIRAALKVPKFTILLIHDNGCGVTDETAEGLVGNGKTCKDRGGANRGSFGMGHLAMNAASTIRTTIYASDHDTEGRILAGHCIMRTGRREKGNADSGADAFLQLRQLDYGKRFHEFARHKATGKWAEQMQQQRVRAGLGECGTSVAIVAPQILEANNQLDELLTAIAANFTLAIHQGRLNVTTDDKTKRLDEQHLDRWLKRDPATTRIRLRYRTNVLRTLTAGSKHTINLELPDGTNEQMTVWLEQNIDDRYSTIDVWREGMRITVVRTRSDFPYIRTSDSQLVNLQPYRLVWNINAATSPTLADAVREGEKPTHDEVIESEMSAESREVVQLATSAIKDFLTEHVDVRQAGESMTLDFLEVSEDSHHTAPDRISSRMDNTSWHQGGQRKKPDPEKRKSRRKNDEPGGKSRSRSAVRRHKIDALAMCRPLSGSSAMVTILRKDIQHTQTLELEMHRNDGERDVGDSRPPWGKSRQRIIDVSTSGGESVGKRSNDGNWRVRIGKGEPDLELTVTMEPTGFEVIDWRAQLMEVR